MKLRVEIYNWSVVSAVTINTFNSACSTYYDIHINKLRKNVIEFSEMSINSDKNDNAKNVVYYKMTCAQLR